MAQHPTNALAAVTDDQLQLASRLTEEQAAILEKVVIDNDLSKLQPSQRLTYYEVMCQMAGGLNKFNRPFEYIELDNKLTLYATRRATDEMRTKRHINIEIVSAKQVGQVYVVEAKATTADGRIDTASGAVPLVEQKILRWESSRNGKRYPVRADEWTPLSPSDYANAIMKAETKAKRRVTLSITGLSMIDESELDTIRNARRIQVDIETGEITAPAQVPETTVPASEPQNDGPDDELRQAKRDLWHMARDTFGWTAADLELVVADTYGDDGITSAGELDLEQLQALYRELVATSADEREAMITGLRELAKGESE